MTQTFTLTIGRGVEIHILAEDSGRQWNGHAVPILTAEQAEIVGAAICDHLDAGACDGLTWEIKTPCTFCGMPHTEKHSCEPLQTYADRAYATDAERRKADRDERNARNRRTR